MKARVIALVALALCLAVGLPATVATAGSTPASARTVAEGSMSRPVPLADAVPFATGPGGCCV
jgi:hypothetical protein